MGLWLQLLSAHVADDRLRPQGVCAWLEEGMHMSMLCSLCLCVVVCSLMLFLWYRIHCTVLQ